MPDLIRLKIEALGMGSFTVISHFLSYTPLNRLLPIAFAITYAIDSVLNKFSPYSSKEIFVLGYFIEAIK